MAPTPISTRRSHRRADTFTEWCVAVCSATAESDYASKAGIALLGDGREFRRLYIHFDVDVLAMATFGGALLPTPPGGPTLAQASALIKHLHARFDVVGLSVLELCDRGDAIRQVVTSLEGARPVSPPA